MSAHPRVSSGPDEAAGAPVVHPPSSRGEEGVLRLRRKHPPPSDAGVSEVVGFLLILTIVMMAIGVVYAVGFPTLNSIQDGSYIGNVEQSMRILALNAQRIATGSAPSQAVEIKLKDSAISVLRKSTLNITFTNGSGGRVTDFSSLNPMTVEADFRDRKIAFEGGGVWRKEPTGTAMLRSPPYAFGNVTVLPLLLISGANHSQSGTGVVRVILDNAGRSQGSAAPDVSTFQNASRLVLNVTSDFCQGWKGYFNTSLSFPIIENQDCSNSVLVVNVSAKISGNMTLFITKAEATGDIQ